MFFVLLLLIPNILLALKTQSIYNLLLSILIIFLFISIIKNTKKLIIFYPFILIIPFICYYIFYYNAPVNEQIISIILETNSQESLQFIGSRIYIYIYMLLGWIILVSFLCYRNYKFPLIWSHRSRWWVLILGNSFLLIMFILNQSTNLENESKFTGGFMVTEKNNFTEEIKKTYPFGLFLTVYGFYDEQKKINQAFDLNKNFKFNVKQNIRSKNTKQVYILVIGETSRRYNWQLNGYHLKTNPFLSRQNNLINFNNMISSSNATRSSIPIMITRKPEQQVFNYNFPEKSIISAFKEAGFSTYWISTQQKFGLFDTSTSVYAKEADHIFFLNKTTYNYPGDTDEIILPILKKNLDNSDIKKFIILHTLGSHFNYSHRYPKKFNVFEPTLDNNMNYTMQDRKYKTELVNSYNNSILYTDYVLNEIIELLKKDKETESFLFYSSDHGEDLFDNECNKSGHGNTTIYNYEVASFIWFSDLYKKNNFNKISWLNKNRNKRINHSIIFPTLVDAANLDIPNDTLDRSLLKKIINYPRLVDGGINFDKTQPKGICREIQ